MQNQKPLVSVHLLTYNHAKFIAQSIESVVNQQTTFPFEIVIGDDRHGKDDGARPAVHRPVGCPENNPEIGSLLGGK